MALSVCGYSCSECFYGKNKLCGMCVPENKMRETCKILPCAKSKKFKTCLECMQRVSCAAYKEGLRHCPMRIELLKKREKDIGEAIEDD